MKLLKSIIAVAWLLGVAWLYAKNHTYYLSSLGTLVDALWVVAPWIVASGGLWLWAKNGERKTRHVHPAVLLAATLALTWLSGTLLYIRLDPAVLTEPIQLFFDGENIAAVEEGARVENDIPPTFKRGDLFLEWSQAESFLPEEVKTWFEPPAVLGFAGVLALNLVKMLGFGAVWLWIAVAFGRAVLREKETTCFSTARALSMGLAIPMGVLFILGWIGQLNLFAAWFLFAVVFGVGLSQWKMMAHAVKAWRCTLKVQEGFIEGLVYAGVIALFFGLNALENVHPFPTGYDSFHVYQNTPNLLVQYGHLITGFQAYNLELIIAWIHLLTGSAQWGMTWVFLLGVVVIGFLTAVVRKRLSWRSALRVMAVFVSLPMVNFLLHIDLKIDFGLLLFAMVATMEVVRAWPHRHDIKTMQRVSLWVGLWVGVAMGVKYTAFFLAATMVGFLAHMFGGFVALSGALLVSLSVLGVVGYGYGVSGFPQAFQGPLLGIMGLVGAGLLVARLIQKKSMQSFLRLTMAFGVTALIIFVPWLGWNLMNANNWSAHSWLAGSSVGVESSIKSAYESAGCSASYTYDELGAYTGDFSGPAWLAPITALWDSTLNPDLPNYRLTDISFLFLGGVFFLGLSATPLTLMTGYYLALWWFGSYGIVWYGLPVVMGLLVFYGVSWERSRLMKGAVGVWLVMALLLRVNEPVVSSSNLLYAGGRSVEALTVSQKGLVNAVMEQGVNSDEGLDANVYLGGGGFSLYFIEYNNERVIRDGFFNTYQCLFNRADPEEAASRFREFGVQYFVISTENLKSEADPAGPLHQAFESFQVFASNALEEVYYADGVTLYRMPDNDPS